MSEISNSTTLVQPCPECVAGKCPNCDGTAWDMAADAPTTCPCERAGHPRRTT